MGQLYFYACIAKKQIFYENINAIRANILREKSLAIYFEDSHFRRIRTFNFILSNIYVDKRSRIR